MTEDWKPFGLSEQEQADYEVLVPGVPDWLREPLFEWIAPHLCDGNISRNSICLQVQMVARIPLGVTSGSVLRSAQVMANVRGLSDMGILRLVDYIVSVRSTSWGTPAKELDKILAAGKSKWTVGDRSGKAGLLERVPAGVQDAVEGAISSGGSAGQVLARAWAQVHGLQANDSGAYADAVRAVEIAAIEVVQPRHSTATLGTVLGQIKQDGDWRLPMREHASAPGTELILAMGRTLWYGHRDRHGAIDYEDITHDEARAAVVLAATLVDWFTSGAIARQPA